MGRQWSDLGPNKNRRMSNSLIGLHYSEVKLQLQKSFASVTDSFLVLQEVCFGDIYLLFSGQCMAFFFDNDHSLKRRWLRWKILDTRHLSLLLLCDIGLSTIKILWPRFIFSCWLIPTIREGIEKVDAAYETLVAGGHDLSQTLRRCDRQKFTGKGHTQVWRIHHWAGNHPAPES